MLNCSVAPWCVFCASLVMWGAHASRKAKPEMEKQFSIDHDGAVLEGANAIAFQDKFIAPTELAMQGVIREIQDIIADESLNIGVVDRATRSAKYDTETDNRFSQKFLGLRDVATLGPLKLRVLPADKDFINDPDVNKNLTYKFGLMNPSRKNPGEDPRRWFEITRDQDNGIPLTYLPWSPGTCTYTFMEPGTRAFLTGPFTGCVAFIVVKDNDAMVAHCNRGSNQNGTRESYLTSWNRVSYISNKEKLVSNGWKDLKLIHQHGHRNETGTAVPGWDLKQTGSHWLWGLKTEANGPWKFGYMQNLQHGGHRNNDPHDPNMKIVSL